MKPFIRFYILRFLKCIRNHIEIRTIYDSIYNPVVGMDSNASCYRALREVKSPDYEKYIQDVAWALSPLLDWLQSKHSFRITQRDTVQILQEVIKKAIELIQDQDVICHSKLQLVWDQILKVVFTDFFNRVIKGLRNDIYADIIPDFEVLPEAKEVEYFYDSLGIDDWFVTIKCGTPVQKAWKVLKYQIHSAKIAVKQAATAHSDSRVKDVKESCIPEITCDQVILVGQQERIRMGRSAVYRTKSPNQTKVEQRKELRENLVDFFCDFHHYKIYSWQEYFEIMDGSISMVSDLEGHVVNLMKEIPDSWLDEASYREVVIRIASKIVRAKRYSSYKQYLKRFNHYFKIVFGVVGDDWTVEAVKSAIKERLGAEGLSSKQDRDLHQDLSNVYSAISMCNKVYPLLNGLDKEDKKILLSGTIASKVYIWLELLQQEIRDYAEGDLFVDLYYIKIRRSLKSCCLDEQQEYYLFPLQITLNSILQSFSGGCLWRYGPVNVEQQEGTLRKAIQSLFGFSDLSGSSKNNFPIHRLWHGIEGFRIFMPMVQVPSQPLKPCAEQCSFHFQTVEVGGSKPSSQDQVVQESAAYQGGATCQGGSSSSQQLVEFYTDQEGTIVPLVGAPRKHKTVSQCTISSSQSSSASQHTYQGDRDRLRSMWQVFNLKKTKL